LQFILEKQTSFHRETSDSRRTYCHFHLLCKPSKKQSPCKFVCLCWTPPKCLQNTGLTSIPQKKSFLIQIPLPPFPNPILTWQISPLEVFRSPKLKKSVQLCFTQYFFDEYLLDGYLLDPIFHIFWWQNLGWFWSLGFFVCLFVLFLGDLYTQHGTQTYNPEIKSRMLDWLNPPGTLSEPIFNCLFVYNTYWYSEEFISEGRFYRKYQPR